MARMIPDSPPSAGPGAKSEARLFEALKTDLPDDFHVYSQLRYIEEGRAREGEADFLVLHREHGMLVIECKGFGVRRKASGEWVRTDHSGRETRLKMSPFAQAQGQVKDLVRRLDPVIRRIFPRIQAFPFVAASRAKLRLHVVGGREWFDKPM